MKGGVHTSLGGGTLSHLAVEAGRGRLRLGAVNGYALSMATEPMDLPVIVAPRDFSAAGNARR